MPQSNPPQPLAALLELESTPQGAFAWDKRAWEARMHDLPDVLNVLEGLPDSVDRESTRLVVLSELSAGRVIPAFVASMVWGYGRVGYGPARVRWVLTGTQGADARDAPLLDSVSERLQAGVEKVREGDLVEAFFLMNNDGRIKYLGGAFFTKWLYFTSAVARWDDARAAPILDKRVADWLNHNNVVSLRVGKTPSYERYLDLLATWGEQYGRTRVQIEKAIFELATGRN